MLETYRKTVDRISEILRMEIDVDRDEVAQLNVLLGQHLAEVNKRLKECDDLLQHGLVAEAIQRCEAKPDLLEAVNVLDFPEFDYWSHSMREAGLPPPPLVEVDIAGDLNDAYIKVQPIGKLLRLHRLHALARSPLPIRIRVMRQLARVDTDNPIWAADIREFEKKRVRQIATDVATATADKNVGVLAQLEDELTDGDWLERPPTALVKDIRRTHTAIRVAQAREELRRLEPELTQAYSNDELATARSLRSQWDAKAEICGLTEDDELSELAAPAIAWMDAEDEQEEQEHEYKESVEDLRIGLDENVPRDELIVLYHNVLRFDREFPKRLESRYHERLKTLELAASRKMRVRVVIAVALLVTVAGFVAFFIGHHLKRQALLAHAANIQTLRQAAGKDMAEGKLDAADAKISETRKYRHDLQAEHPDFVEAPEIKEQEAQIATAETKLSRLRREEDQRSEQVRQYLDRLRKQLVTLGDPELEQELRWKEIDAGLQLAEEASQAEIHGGKVFKLGSEQNDLKLLAVDLRDRRRQLQQAVDQEFQESLARLVEDLEAMDVGDDKAYAAANDRLQQLAGAALVSRVLKVSLGPHQTKLARRRDQFDLAQKQQKRLDAITQSAGNLGLYQVQLNSYAREFPNTPRGTELQAVLSEELKHWEVFEEALELSQSWIGSDLRRLSPVEAEKMAKQASEYVAAYENLPPADEFKVLLPYVEAIARRTDVSGQPIVAKLRTVLADRVLIGLFALRTRDGKSYYGPNMPTYTKKDTTTWYYVDLDLERNERIKVPNSEVVQPPSKNMKLDWRAPQAPLAAELRAELAGLEHGNWEEKFCEMLRLVQKDKRTEPLLRYTLYQMLVETGSQGSYCLQQALAGVRTTLAGTVVQLDANWLNPEDSDGRKASTLADLTLQSLPDLEKVQQKATDMHEALGKPAVNRKYVFGGWLYKHDEGEWTCQLRKPLNSGVTVDLFVIDASGDSVRLEKIGAATRDGVTLSPSGVRLREGRPVYVSKSTDPAS